jgi:hypothetical protein
MTGAGDDDPETHRRALLAGVEAMRALHLSAALCARVAGCGAATLRRWRVRRARGLPLVARRPRPALAAPVRRAAERRVRQLHGLIGAAALSRAVAGLSRRAAAAIKADTLTALERERKGRLTRVRVTVPGVMRGLDAMQLARGGPLRYALIAADAAVPYRTSVTSGRCYDAALVARALERDLNANGAPLVYRLDRATCHDAPAPRALLAAHRVLVLHGPPRHARYYGQLERQNREHRAWLRLDPDPAPAEACLRQMLHRVNCLWPRRSLGWRTAEQSWRARPPLTVDRQSLYEEVIERAARNARTLELRGQPADFAERLAIEQTLMHRGYLQRKIGGWC